MEPTTTAFPPNPKVLTKTVQPCTHSRIVDEVLNADGAKTGQLICIECLAKFPDPLLQKPDA